MGTMATNQIDVRRWMPPIATDQNYTRNVATIHGFNRNRSSTYSSATIALATNRNRYGFDRNRSNTYQVFVSHECDRNQSNRYIHGMHQAWDGYNNSQSNMYMVCINHGYDRNQPNTPSSHGHNRNQLNIFADHGWMQLSSTWQSSLSAPNPPPRPPFPSAVQLRTSFWT